MKNKEHSWCEIPLYELEPDSNLPSCRPLTIIERKFALNQSNEGKGNLALTRSVNYINFSEVILNYLNFIDLIHCMYVM